MFSFSKSLIIVPLFWCILLKSKVVTLLPAVNAPHRESLHKTQACAL